MSLLDPPDRHHLLAAEGWCELGNPAEAELEWDRLSEKAQAHPAALELRWQILSRLEDWERAVGAAEQLITCAPHVCSGWLHRAYALRRAASGGLKRAWDALHPAAEQFPEEEVVAYNLACYATQMGRADEGWEWFLRALQISSSTADLRKMALKDDDLRPLWERIRGLR